MTGIHPFEPVPVSASRAPRFDLFGPIHKAIRFVMCDTLCRAGQTCFDSDAEARGLRVALDELLTYCELHADLEDRFLCPALAGRVNGAIDVFDKGHARLARLVAELRTLGDALVHERADGRARVGRILYDHLGALVAENLAHMAEEEQVVAPLMLRLYTDAELHALHDDMLAAIGADERRRSVIWMLRSSSPPEREDLVSVLLAQAPGEAVTGLLQVALPALPAAEHAALVARCAASRGQS